MPGRGRLQNNAGRNHGRDGLARVTAAEAGDGSMEAHYTLVSTFACLKFSIVRFVLNYFSIVRRFVLKRSLHHIQNHFHYLREYKSL